jgi:regulator of PEP synthase PpsR (kinase-PPPase family)
MLEEAEMSQVVNAVTSSSKRPYRKGNPVSAAERQQKAVARKSTHKEVRVFVRDKLKNQLQIMCENEGITQAEMIERLIERESAKLGIDVTTSHS